MKFAFFAVTLSLLCLVVSASSSASDGKATITGGGTFSISEKKGYFNFNAVTHADGSVTGHMTLRDPEEVPNQDVDANGEPDSDGLPDGVELTADLDSVTVNGNRAAFSGVITSATTQRFVGLRMILAIEDNGEGANAEPDKITWGLYQRVIPRLVADFENPNAGEFPVGTKILATDAERPEEGAFLVGDSDFDSHSFPLSSYSLTNIDGGNIQLHK